MVGGTSAFGEELRMRGGGNGGPDHAGHGPLRVDVLVATPGAHSLPLFARPSLSSGFPPARRSHWASCDARSERGVTMRRAPGAPPGRCVNHVEDTAGFSSALGRVSVLVLDEADRMLDMGFQARERTWVYTPPSSSTSVHIVWSHP